MRHLIILSLAALLASSCSDFPTMKKDHEVCYVNIDGGYCRCAYYDFNYGELRATTESENYPIGYCDRYIAMSADTWVELIVYLDKIYTWKDKNFKKRRMKNKRKMRKTRDEDTPLGLMR